MKFNEGKLKILEQFERFCKSFGKLHKVNKVIEKENMRTGKQLGEPRQTEKRRIKKAKMDSYTGNDVVV